MKLMYSRLVLKDVEGSCLELYVYTTEKLLLRSFKDVESSSREQSFLVMLCSLKELRLQPLPT